tara:strand:- start:1920 stop:2117 length:198 start_codon:yes stop_codon:yes gene_type:complete
MRKTYTYFSTYVDGDRRADVIQDSTGNWGIEMIENNEFIRREFFTGHSESYAEDAAENYVMRIKN